jgi:hypothetical protein
MQRRTAEFVAIHEGKIPRTRSNTCCSRLGSCRQIKPSD